MIVKIAARLSLEYLTGYNREIQGKNISRRRGEANGDKRQDTFL
ncbi:hypothetical protein [Clostridium thermosuccinogenes]|jgi:hypothetical protein|nr:hypothetical protein [Pseudoclostridium thermosuccinogenes]